jgi:hypothetical protein
MSTLLTSGQVGRRNYSQQRRIRQEAIDKWNQLGFLDGLRGHVRENIAQLYESQASQLLNENNPFIFYKTMRRHKLSLYD